MRYSLRGLISLSIAAGLLLAAGTASAWYFKEWKSGIVWDEPPVVDPGFPEAPPSDAIVLFDGTDMSAWNGGAEWTIKDGYGIVGGNVTSKQKFGDCQLHVEFASPREITGSGQGRGNSGVYLMGRYELQILDSYENDTYYDGQCGAIYKQRPPLVNASRRPGEWQTYDIIFTAPRFHDDGTLESPAYMTVLHNGVLIQNHFELQGTTAWASPPAYEKHGEREPILLQYHGDPVRFRNIWVRDLAQAPTGQAARATVSAVNSPEAANSSEVLLGEGDLLTGVPGEGPISMDQILEWLSDPANHEELQVQLPLGLAAGASEIKGLDENPLTRAKIELGRQLYFDPRLSADSSVSCASCHHPEEGYARRTRFGVGIEGQEGGRNSPVSYNRILSDLQFWDGRAATLEEQAKGPIENPIEMGNTHETCIESLKEIPGYVAQFEKVFGTGSVNIDNVAKAIASFERAVVTGPSPFDYYDEFQRFARLDKEDLEDLLENEDFARRYHAARTGAREQPMSASAVRGRDLFFGERVNCAACHVGANLTDEKYHNLGVGMDSAEPDVGRYEVTGKDEDWGAFKTPTIRNVALSAPYMHDGSLETLMQVVEFYDKGGIPNKNLSDKVKKLNLTEQEKKDLVAFMEACTGPFPEVEQNRLPE